VPRRFSAGRVDHRTKATDAPVAEVSITDSLGGLPVGAPLHVV
jgi:hypothetical protein